MQPVPPPRVDRHDRVVADTDREMARLAERAHERMSTVGLAVPTRPGLGHHLPAFR
jgi:hypothetical protein